MCLKESRLSLRAALSLYRSSAFLAQDDNKELKKVMSNYLSKIGRGYKKASDTAAGAVAGYIGSVGAGISIEDLQRGSLMEIFKAFSPTWDASLQQNVERYIDSAYTHLFSKDREGMFGKMAGVIPQRTFNVRDEATIDYFTGQNRFYLGRVLSDDASKNAVFSRIREIYLDKGFPIGDLRPSHLSEIRKLMGATIDTQDWKVSRTIATTVNRMRAMGAVESFRAAGITRYRIVGVPDNRQCPYCSALQGKVFEVHTAHEQMTKFMSSESHDTISAVNPFVTSKIVGKSPQEVSSMDSAGLSSLGISTPPFHPFCRDRIVAVFEELSSSNFSPKPGTRAGAPSPAEMLEARELDEASALAKAASVGSAKVVKRPTNRKA